MAKFNWWRVAIFLIVWFCGREAQRLWEAGRPWWQEYGLLAIAYFLFVLVWERKMAVR